MRHMASNFSVGDNVEAIRSNNQMRRYTPGKVIKVTKGTRVNSVNSSNRSAEVTICFFMCFDFFTCNRCQPESMYRYKIKYDQDGVEEDGIPATNIKLALGTKL